MPIMSAVLYYTPSNSSQAAKKLLPGFRLLATGSLPGLWLRLGCSVLQTLDFFPARKDSALCQGTTSVVPVQTTKGMGFSPCEWEPVRKRRSRRATKQPEGRKIVAHGASRGKATKKESAPEGAAEQTARAARNRPPRQGLKPLIFARVTARLKSWIASG